ncbi:MAG: hypothetical protein GX774_21365 [Armatimonadetes bacterium]|jgi:uncharacterized membrane protein YeaQ/YmgE (transglycosylase-associated protein family)|nr:hypothetical protein [Armatimonadota bacterium]
MDLLVLLIVVLVLLVAGFAVLGAAVQLLWALLIGAIVGAIANWIVSLFQPAGGPQGLLATALAGVGGSLLASLLFGRHGLLASLLGAMVVVILWKWATAGRYAARR